MCWNSFRFSEEATESFDCNIIGVVTDNEKKMQVMKESLKETNLDLTVYGCSAHWLNLLGQDVTPPQVINQIVEINKYFRNHHVPGALLGEISGSVKPHLPENTRWNSQVACTETYIRNRPYMLMVIAQNEDIIDSRIRTLILNVGLYNEAEHLRTQLQPVSNALDKLQSDSVSIADACEWLSLLQEKQLEPCMSQMEKRFDQAMTPCHYLANMLHPVYRGKNLKTEHISSAQDMLLNLNSDSYLVPALLTFMTDFSHIPKALQHEPTIKNVKVDVWWWSVERSKTVDRALCTLAIKLLLMPVSSAATQRIFSNFGMIQSKLRNRLGLAKATKLVYCYRTL